MSYTATYSPKDNKLRLYSTTRLDRETYARVKAAGFIWAPKQDLFVAPMWTPSREDLLIELAGEIEDEDRSLVDRAGERADRFSDYKESRIEDAQRAHDAVHRIADNIPFGQPILVGHHSERHARKDAERIENGMRKTVQMWQTARYWEQRAAGALHHAKYKALPGVRHRRIKGLEADKRKQERNKQEAEMWLKLWTECANERDKELQAKVALRIAGMCHLHMPRKEGDRDGIGDICVRDVRQVCPVRIDVHHLSRTQLAPIVSNSGGDGDVAKDLLQLLGFRSETWQIFAGNSDLNRNSNRLARFESPRIDDCSRNLSVQFRLQKGKQWGRIMIVFRSQNHLSIVGLPVLGCGATPEARTAAAHKRGHRLQDILRVSVLWMAPAILFRYSAGDGFHLLSGGAGRARRSVFRQPHIDVRKILKILWKELRL